MNISNGGMLISGAFYGPNAELDMSNGTFTNTTLIFNNYRISNGSSITIGGYAPTQFTATKTYLVE